MPNRKLAILIINHETPEETKELIKHIHTYFIPDNFDLTVADNSKWYTLETADIHNPHNPGFDQTVIKWLKDVKGNYAGYWTLNSDCILNPHDYTEQILDYLEDDPKIGLFSTLVNEPKGWGDDTPLQNPQNIDTKVPHTIGYIDFQSAIISNNLLSKFKFDNDLIYFAGGLDMDFNVTCEKYNMKKVLEPKLSLKHLGAQSYRNPDGSLVVMRTDLEVQKDLHTHISGIHLYDIIKEGYTSDELIYIGLKKRHSVNFYEEKRKMLKTPSKRYKKLKIHLFGAPHMNVKWNDHQMTTCAYSTKIYLLAKLLMEKGHELIYYGVEGNDVPCTENVTYVPKEVWERSHGSRSAETFHDFGDHLESYQYGANSIVEEVNKRFTDNRNEIILTTFGLWSPKLREIKGSCIEWGIGYDHPWTQYRVYESYNWQHCQYGKMGENYDIEGPKWFDAVIPGYVDKDQFRFQEKKEDYLLFLGRIMGTKGIHAALQLADHFKIKLKVAGNGNIDLIKKYNSPYVEYVGVANNDEKRELYANAKATLCMTQYVEPFGNVHVESMMSGTPVITTDWGVYTETVPHGLVGYRGRVWSDHCYAVENLDKINPQDCRDWAVANFSLEAVYPKFNAYFEKVADIHTTGEHPWYNTSVGNSPNRFTDYYLNYLNYLKEKND